MLCLNQLLRSQHLTSLASQEKCVVFLETKIKFKNMSLYAFSEYLYPLNSLKAYKAGVTTHSKEKPQIFSESHMIHFLIKPRGGYGINKNFKLSLNRKSGYQGILGKRFSTFSKSNFQLNGGAQMTNALRISVFTFFKQSSALTFLTNNYLHFIRQYIVQFFLILNH